MKIYHVYILLCSDKTYYTGITSDLMGRLESHLMGKYKDSYTFTRRPVNLVCHCDFTDPNLAVATKK